MKKIVLVATALLLGVSTNAQNAVGSWSLQPKAGINVATMTNDDDAKIRVGLVAGAELEYQATPMLSISAGALYSQQGAKAKVEGIDGTIKMDYVNVPILANFHVAQGLAVKVGIQPGFLINDKVEVSANGVDGKISAEVELKESYRALGVDADIPSVDFAIPLGVSYEYSHVVLDARYNFSLTNAISVLGESTKHSVFQITLGYKFSL
jgi:opacity protein-like surface antigen